MAPAPPIRKNIPARIESTARTVTPVGLDGLCKAVAYITLAPHDGHLVAPAGILAPQFLQNVPI